MLKVVKWLVSCNASYSSYFAIDNSQQILAIFKNKIQIIRAEVPMREMLGGYATTLRSMSKGRASYSMEFECYREMPKNVEEEVLGKK